MKVLAIIPARGGSKRLPNKNIKLLNGKELIWHTINAANQSQLINKTIISTEDQKIKEVALKYDVEIINRPNELVTDTASTLDVARYIANLMNNYDIFVILQPTSPLRTAEDIDKIIQLVLNGADSAETFCEADNPEFLFKINKNRNANPIDKENFEKRKQEVAKYYKENGAVYVVKRETLVNKGLYGNNHKAVIMSKTRSVDIDTQEDFDLVENIIKKQKNKVFFIAEAGVNHDGDFEKAKQLVDIAKEAGADAVKFQTFVTERIVTKDVGKVDYQVDNTEQGNQYEMLKKLELTYDQFRDLKKYCEEKKIMFMSTPDDIIDADFLKEIGMKIFKIGSPDLTNHAMLEHISKYDLPMIISSGMANLEEIKEAVKVIKKHNNKLTLLHCTTNYPTKFEDVNLNAMLLLKEEFPEIEIGYSDHTLGKEVPVLATLMGAKIIEKHFTYDKNAEGPDHKASASPEELKQIVKAVRKAEKYNSIEDVYKIINIEKETIKKILGEKEKKPVKIEEKTMNLIRKFIVAKKDISQGEIITKEILGYKRSNTKGILPQNINKILNKKARKTIQKDKVILLKDLS